MVTVVFHVQSRDPSHHFLLTLEEELTALVPLSQHSDLQGRPCSVTMETWYGVVSQSVYSSGNVCTWSKDDLLCACAQCECLLRVNVSVCPLSDDVKQQNLKCFYLFKTLSDGSYT